MKQMRLMYDLLEEMLKSTEGGDRERTSQLIQMYTDAAFIDNPPFASTERGCAYDNILQAVSISSAERDSHLGRAYMAEARKMFSDLEKP